MEERNKMNIIHPSFKHGDNFQIGAFCIIEEGVRIGNDVKIDNYVLLKRGTIIEDDVWVDSYVRSSGKNIICTGVTLRFGCTIAKEVLIHRNAFISPNVMTIYSTHHHKAKGGIVIGENAFIGTAAVIGPSVKIGENVVIGANSYVTKNCLDGKIYFGSPAKRIK
jgi:UDP-N-acetylglucosamine acyltransferase